MSTPITPAATVPPATYPIPADGESVSSANTAQYVQPLANSIEYLRLRTPGAVNNMVRRVPVSSGVFGSSAWSFVSALGGGTGKPCYIQGGVGTGVLTFPITHLLPSIGTIVGASVLIDGGSGHAGLPGVMPALTMLKWASDFGNNTFVDTPPTTIQTNSDASASVANYEKVHAINLSTFSETIALGTWEYALQLVGESGANSLGAIVLGSISFQVSIG